METSTLQRIAQWEQAHLKGNKKPITAREYPALRPKKDIILKDIAPMPLVQKRSHTDTKKSSLGVKEIPGQNSKPVATTSENTASSTASKNSLSSRKAFYESWDKYDVDQALNDMDVKIGDKKPPPEKTTSSHATKIEVAAPGKPNTLDPAAAIVEKEKGNDFFKKKEYEKAIEHYSASMALDPSNPILPINRAMALLKVERFTDAERDCTLGLKLDSKNVKALWRRGIARRSLGKVDDARRDFEAALKIDPINKAVNEELAKLQQQPTPSNVKTSTPPSSANQLSTPTVKRQETNPSTSSPVKDTASSTPISSKRVLIKEVESDEGSELFTSATPAVKKSTLLTTTSPPVAPLPVTMTPATLQTSETLPLQAVPTTKNEPSTLAAPQTSASRPRLYSASEESNQGVHMSAPMTTLDFQRDWKSYSKNSALLYQYIKLIQPETLPALFKSSFESDYLSSMLAVYREYYITSEEPQLLYRSLLNLAKVQRFDMTLMFMTGTDKKDLVAIFRHLNSRLSDQTTYNQQTLAVLASKFKTTNY